jgi:hypothetical protein
MANMILPTISKKRSIVNGFHFNILSFVLGEEGRGVPKYFISKLMIPCYHV